MILSVLYQWKPYARALDAGLVLSLAFLLAAPTFTSTFAPVEVQESSIAYVRYYQV
jgi:hypothetical protein